MPQVQAQRRLVKSPPELWTELSDAAALAGHLGEFGEIRITRLEPETKVVWEGDRASGTVELDSAGWGTQVTLTVEVETPEPEPVPDAEPEPEPEPEPVAVEPEPEPAEERRPPAPQSVAAISRPRGFFARFFGWDDRVEGVIEHARETVAEAPEPQPGPVEPEPEPVAVEPEPEPVAVQPEPEPDPEPEPEPEADEDTFKVLEHVLDQLGQAHHRPFSRA